MAISREVVMPDSIKHARPKRFPVLIRGRWWPLLIPFGVTQERAFVQVGERELRVQRLVEEAELPEQRALVQAGPGEGAEADQVLDGFPPKAGPAPEVPERGVGAVRRGARLP